MHVGTMIMHLDTFIIYTFLLFQCVWKRLYSTASVSDGGTMYHLRNLINRRNVTSDPSHNVDPSEVITIVEAYIFIAAMDLYQMKSPSDDPVDPSLFSNIDYNKPGEKREALIAQSIRDGYIKIVDISLETKIQTLDGVYSYTCEVISLGISFSVV